MIGASQPNRGRPPCGATSTRHPRRTGLCADQHAGLERASAKLRTMLVRIFRGRVHPGMEERYSRYLRDVAAPQILSTAGAREVQIFEPLNPSDEFLVKSVWSDVGSLSAFAGRDWSRPRILDSEKEMIASAQVSHHREGSRFGESAVTSSSERITVDPSSGIAEVDGEIFALPPTESRLLAELLHRADRAVEPAELARAVWRGNGVMKPNDVRRSIYRLRRLIRDHERECPVIRNRRGYGYVIEA